METRDAITNQTSSSEDELPILLKKPILYTFAGLVIVLYLGLAAFKIFWL